MERLILSIITKNEEILRELVAEKEHQQKLIKQVMSNVDSLINDVKSIREGKYNEKRNS